MQIPLQSPRESAAAPSRRDEKIIYGTHFTVFCFWTFVLLCRPQDIFPAIAPLRPALLTGIFTMLLVLLRSGGSPAVPLFGEKQMRLYAALLLVMIMGIPFSLYAGRSFEVIFTAYINVVLFVFIFFKVVDRVEKLSAVLLVGCLGNGLYSLYSVVSGEIVSGRLYFADMFDPNDLAFFALSFLPFNLLFITRGNSMPVRMACALSFGAGTLLVLMSSSRGGLLAFGMAAFLLLFTKTRVVRPSMKVMFVILCLAFVAFAPLNLERYTTFFEIKEDYNVWDETGRLNIWKIGLNEMLRDPLTGVGVENFSMAVGLDRQKRNLESQPWQAAHNMVVQIGTETGVIGMGLFLLMSLNVVRIFRKTKRRACPEKLTRIGEMGMVGFTGLFVSGMFLSQAYSVYWAFYVAVSAVMSRLAADAQRTTDAATREIGRKAR
ncbi:MAG: O-Antigen ligase [Deltaproteobacteria bacterium ADurb.BinA179]|nr:MAG: O-Antigen ligase [Deltaproteobacteria bacterium ADurb.BinA179]HNU75554.1 O-antigen ligase family protein [Deltaproteobacteria bacterium]HRR69768.1 O-antigen ligase family protein [Desulfomonilia bacterium]HON62438.1 O-antigen ligase family protein [Deltaproteobacteria bacterium]HPX51322.1 O-antigen ligase family protein [Deltaproteobacteria bacterium]